MQQLSLSGRTVCLVDDDSLARQAMRLKLREHGIAVLEASGSEELYDIMEREPLDCILLDYELGAENGLSVQEQLRLRFLDVPPVIMLTVNDNQRTIIKAFRTGVHDYVLKKGLRSEELIQSIRTAVDRRTENVAARSELERMKSQSDIEDATGLYRREAIVAMLAELFQNSAASHKPLSIIAIRMNELEAIQLEAGQVVAKRVVAAFAAKLRSVLRVSDVCGRDAGDSFIYIVDIVTRQKDLTSLIGRLKEALTFTHRHETRNFQISAGFGLATFPSNGLTPEAVLTSAREALDSGVSHIATPCIEEPVGEASATANNERRRHPRQRVFKGGKIMVSAGQSVLDCMVRDQSGGGARLRLQAPCGLPETFDLRISGAGQVQRCRLAWQQGQDVGVEFLK